MLYTRHPHRGAWNSNKQDEGGGQGPYLPSSLNLCKDPGESGSTNSTLPPVRALGRAVPCKHGSNNKGKMPCPGIRLYLIGIFSLSFLHAFLLARRPSPLFIHCSLDIDWTDRQSDRASKRASDLLRPRSEARPRWREERKLR